MKVSEGYIRFFILTLWLISVYRLNSYTQSAYTDCLHQLLRRFHIHVPLRTFHAAYREVRHGSGLRVRGNRCILFVRPEQHNTLDFSSVDHRESVRDRSRGFLQRRFWNRSVSGIGMVRTGDRLVGSTNEKGERMIFKVTEI